MKHNILKGEHFQGLLLEAGEQLKSGLLLIEIASLRVTYCNSKALALLGNLPESFNTHYERFLMRVTTEDQEFVKEQITRLLREKISTEFEFHLTDQNNATRIK